MDQINNSPTLQKIANSMADGGWDKERIPETIQFVTNRGQHYADKLGVKFEEVISAWDAARNYASANYYQDANFPEINGKVLLVDSIEQFKEYCQGKGFICGSCDKVTKSPYDCKSCGWKTWGLLGAGKTATFIVLRPAMRGEWIFRPVVMN